MAANGFIPDNQFVPDAEPKQAKGFIPDDQFQSDEDKYGSDTEVAKTFAEGALKGALPLGLGTALESTVLNNEKEQKLRAETNPGTHLAGDVAGFGASALIPVVGQARVLGGAGKAVAGALGLEGATSAAARVGSGIAKQASEMAILGLGDELSKTVLQDPGQSADTMLTNIGMSALIGGALGGTGALIANPLRNLVKDSNLTKLLTAVKQKADGVSGTVSIGDLAEQAGVNISPEAKAAMSGQQQATRIAQELQESGGKAGDSFRASLDDVKKQSIDSIYNAFGKTADDVADLSAHEVGAGVQDAMVKELRGITDPISAQFGPIKEQFEQIGLPLTNVSKKIQEEIGGLEHKLAGLPKSKSNSGYPLSSSESAAEGQVASQREALQSQIDSLKQKVSEPQTSIPFLQDDLGERIGKLALDEGYTQLPGSEGLSSLNGIIKNLSNVKDLEGLRNFQSITRDELNSKGLYRLAKQVSGLFRDYEDRALEAAITDKAPELLAAHKIARQSYREAMGTIEQLNDRLHVGKYYGPDSFIKGLSEMTPETVLRRLQGFKDGDLLALLQKQFPSTAQAIKQYTMDGILAKATKARGAQELGINTKTLFNEINKLSPEMKAFAFPPETLASLDANSKLLASLPARINPSGTAKTLDKLWSQLPGGAAALISSILGHSGVGGYIVGTTAKHLVKDVPEAIKLSLLKFLGSTAPVEVAGFETMTKALTNMYKGARLTTKAVDGVFKAGSEVLPESALPTEKSHERLEKSLKAAKLDPSPLANSTGMLAHYMPEQAAALGSSIGRVLTYLDSIAPNEDKMGVLGPKRIPSAFETAKYERARNIAEQPLMVLQHIKDGSLTQDDVVAVTSMYPDLVRGLKDKLTSKIAELSHKEDSLPYETQLTLSLFLGMPLSDTMTPQAIAAYQPTPEAPQEQGNAGKTPSSSKLKGLNTLAQSNATPGQSRDQDRAKSQG